MATAYMVTQQLLIQHCDFQFLFSFYIALCFLQLKDDLKESIRSAIT